MLLESQKSPASVLNATPQACPRLVGYALRTFPPTSGRTGRRPGSAVRFLALPASRRAGVGVRAESEARRAGSANGPCVSDWDNGVTLSSSISKVASVVPVLLRLSV